MHNITLGVAMNMGKTITFQVVGVFPEEASDNRQNPRLRVVKDCAERYIISDGGCIIFEPAGGDRDENILEKKYPVLWVVRGRPCDVGWSVAGRLHLL